MVALISPTAPFAEQDNRGGNEADQDNACLDNGGGKSAPQSGKLRIQQNDYGNRDSAHVARQPKRFKKGLCLP